ncbi:MAG TPA: pitrilysin family protein [Polyangiaceae bacterium]|nr:pitrilysin family protein [Polyangiaceae bacterium]
MGNRLGPRDSAAARRSWAEQCSSGAPEGAQLKYEDAHPFGGEVVHRWRLGNGLTVLVLVDAAAPIASYHTWFKVGSRHEQPGKTGLAHLFEHLMFNETENLKAGVFDRKLEESGAETNAATWVDWTYYHESLPSDRIKLAVKLEAERMTRLVLREPQVKSEKEVVANERRYRVDDDVEGAAGELLYKTAFVKHPYRWPTIGWMQDIEGFSPEDCTAFYRTYYAPNNATIVAVGDIREGDLLLAIRDAYGSIPSQAVPPEDICPEPTQLDERVVEVSKPTATDKLLLAYKGPALGDADHATMTVLSEVLFGGRASRLYRTLIVERELATDVRGWVSTFRDPGLFECWATARGGHKTQDIQALMDEAFERVRRDVVTDDELTRAKARLELGMLQQLETIPGKAEQIGFFETVLGDPAYAFRRVDAFRRTTTSDLRRAARRYLVDHGRTIVRVTPDATGAPAQAAQ